jgi:hypothetical protein
MCGAHNRQPNTAHLDVELLGGQVRRLDAEREPAGGTEGLDLGTAGLEGQAAPVRFVEQRRELVELDLQLQQAEQPRPGRIQELDEFDLSDLSLEVGAEVVRVEVPALQADLVLLVVSV